MTYQDVAGTAYYAESARWAASEGIVQGYDANTFRPEQSISRQELAAILYRYAQYKGYDTTQGGMAIREFSDYEEIANWAMTAMTWAVNAGVISGNADHTLNPTGQAIRAEVAQMMMNFLNGQE